MKSLNGSALILLLVAGSLFQRCTGMQKDKNVYDNSKRGIVVYPSDLISVGVEKWIKFMQIADLNLLGIHGFNDNESLPKLKTFIESKDGILLFNECKKHHIDIEFETHALHLLLPRELFKEHPEYFRKDKNGVRQNDLNMCFSSEEAYSEIEENIEVITKWLKPTTNRYFFWTDDALNGYCHCDLCIKYSESEQALIYENRLLSILRKINPSATLAHLAYNNTYNAPLKVKPVEGIFLEYAPIDRDLSKPIPVDHIWNLTNNFYIFPENTAHVLEYWIDVSKFSGWKRDSLIKIPWNRRNCERDVELYKNMGITSITSFGAWINSDYLSRYREDSTFVVLREYGASLK